MRVFVCFRKKIFKKINDNFIFVEFELLNERMSINE